MNYTEDEVLLALNRAGITRGGITMNLLIEQIQMEHDNRINFLFGWRCIRCNAHGDSPNWDASQTALDQHWRQNHGRPMPEPEELSA